jgi:hypothetical protein
MEKVVTYDELNDSTFIRWREKEHLPQAQVQTPAKELSAEEQIDASMERLRLRKLAREAKAAS